MEIPKLGINDTLLKVDANAQTVTATNSEGRRLWQHSCLADGQHPNWRAIGGDTPPGLYKLGEAYLDYQKWIDDPGYPPYTRELASFGWCSFDMVDLEGNEDNNGRAGIMLHGGGSAEGWPGAWAPYQPLHYTVGCLRMHNAHLHDYVRPLVQMGTVYVMVER
jgi:hypothetical protein